MVFCCKFEGLVVVFRLENAFHLPSHHVSYTFFTSPGWNELLIASFSHRSIAVKDGILLATGLHVHRNSAHSAGVGAIFDRSEVTSF